MDGTRDLVYVVGGDSTWGYNELRYSIRSAEKNLNFNKLIIVGYKPNFLNKSVENIYIPDDKGHKYLNVAYKIKKLLTSDLVSDEFIFMNDDFFLLKEFPKIPYYFNKSVKQWVRQYPFYKGKYYKQIEKLYEAFPEGKFFELHFPMVYNKKMAIDVIEKHQLNLTLMLRSYYCNEYIDIIKPVESLDYKIYSQNNINYMIKSSPFVSTTNEVAANSEFKNMMASRFPKKSKFE